MARKEINAIFNDNELNKMNYNYIELFDTATKINKTINDLVLESGESNMEVVQARAGEPTLDARLNKTDQEIQVIDGKVDENYDRLSSSLAEKATRTELNNIGVNQISKDKGKFDQTYMSEEFLQQMAGNTPINSIPAYDSIDEGKVTFKPVLSDETGKNLFNKRNVEFDKKLDDITKQPIVNADTYVTNYISIKPNTYYVLTLEQLAVSLFFYDGAKNYISKVDNAEAGEFTTPINARFIRFSAITETSLVTTQLEQNTIRTNQEPYTPMINGNLVSDYSINKEKINFPIVTGEVGKNLFDKSRVVYNKRCIKGGVAGFETSKDVFLSHPIKIDINSNYVINDSAITIQFYDINGDFISWLTGADAESFITPSTADHLYFSGLTSRIDTIQMEKNQTSTAYEPYKVIPSWYKEVEDSTKHKLNGLKWIVEGDSNSEYNGTAVNKYHDTIAQRTGIIVENHAQSGSGYLPYNPGDYTRQPMYERIPDYSVDADIITALGGGNNVSDLYNGVYPLGTLGDTDPNGSFYGALDNYFKLVIAKYPTKKIAALSQFKRGNHEAKEDLLQNMVRALKEVCGYHGIPVLDLYNGGNIHAHNADFVAQVMPDNVHINDIGHDLIADKIQTFLESL